jgi:NACHT domain
MAVQVVLIQLATAATRAAAKLWVGDRAAAADATTSAIDLLSDRLQSQMDQRRLYRMMEQIADTIAERLEPMLQTEFRSLSENEKTASILAVSDTITKASLRDEALFAGDLDAIYLDRYLRRQVPGITRDLSQAGRDLYGLLLREACGYIIDISRGLPTFSADALTEVLRRETNILVGIREILSRLPQRQTADAKGVIYDYRQLVVRLLDQIEVFGASVADSSRRYPLSVAYLSLTAVADYTLPTVNPGRRVEDLLASTQRLFIRGEAGLGKTTLLQWIAVRSAQRDFPARLDDWNDTLPFLIPLRRYNSRPLPAPEDFLEELGRNIAGELPTGWVQQQLREGRAVVLVDGVDELSPERRQEAREWLRELVSTFPRSRYVVTSRPGAAGIGWLSSEGFKVADLQSMTEDDVEIFIHRWHDAVSTQYANASEVSELEEYRDDLIAQIKSRNHLRRIAAYPLLCALVCALHRDRRSALPGNRMELYEVALQMLLERRDAERKILELPGLGRTEKTLLLADLAYWLLRNGYVDAERARVVDQLTRTLRGMTQITAEPSIVYRHLLERSGLIREPVEGRVDFVHRTFQEYLAARAAIHDSDDIGTLIEHAHMDQWRDVVVMAAGHASRGRRADLITRLLDRGDSKGKYRDPMHLLALACLETSPELDPELRERIELSAANLLPPKSVNVAGAFAAAGPFVLDLLADAQPANAREAAGTIRAAVETGLSDALSVLARFSKDTRPTVQNELVAAWGRFDVEEYARVVLADLPIKALSTNSSRFTSALRHLKYVTELQCAVPNDGNIHCIPSQVASLHTIGVAPKLASLHAPGLTTLSIEIDPPTSNRGKVSLNTLSQPASLTSLSVKNGRVANLDGLCMMANLHELSLIGTLDGNDLAQVKRPWSARKVHVENATNFFDLTPLRNLSNLYELSLIGYERLSVDGISRWANTLRKLSLRDCERVDLAPLSSLHCLAQLDLKGVPIANIRPLMDIPSLSSLTIDSLRAARDLHQLTTMRNLKEIRIGFGGVVELGALADMKDLTIIVEMGTPLRGEHLLDSSVILHTIDAI